MIGYRVRFRINGKLDGETFDDEVAAEEFAALVDRVGGDAAVRIRNARDGNSTATPTLADWFVHYLEHWPGVTDGTRAEYERLAERSWMHDLGPLPVDAIDRDAVAKWVNRQSKTITRFGRPTSVKSLENMHGLLSQVLAGAVEAGHIQKNPARLGRSLHLPSGEREEMVVLTHDEFARILAHIVPYWRPLIVTLAGTGMRWGEATALQWGAVTLDGPLPNIRIVRAWKKGATQRVMGIPKTRKSRRTISLPPEVVDVLRPLSEGKTSTDLVFTGPRSGYVHHQSFRRVWHNAVKRSGIEKRPRVHDLRHSHVAWLADTGTVSIQDIQARLGHESIKTTWDVYGALFDHAHGRTAAAASLALSQAMPELLPAEDDVHPE